MVKIEDGVHSPQPVVVKKATNSHATTKFTNNDLPAGSMDLWRPVLIPTFAKFVASYDDPWVIDDQDTITALQKVWDAVYPKIPYTVKTKEAVFVLVSLSLNASVTLTLDFFFVKALQRISEWRGNFGSTALVMINHFLDHEKELFDTDDKRAEYSKECIKSSSFLYENVDNPEVLFISLCAM